MIDYITHHHIWKIIQKNLCDPFNKQSLKEFNFLIKILHQQYNSALNENRFTVGGSVEFFLLCLFRSFKLKCVHAGTKAVGYDLLINDEYFSIKFSAKPQNAFILSNKQGKNIKHEWTYPTIFVIGGLGIGYADPLQIENNSTNLVETGSNLSLKTKTLIKFWEQNKKYYWKYPLITKAEARKTLQDNETNVASAKIAKTLIKEHSKILKKYLF